MDRREFIKKCILGGAALAAFPSFMRSNLIAGTEKRGIDVVAIKGGTPDKMFISGIAALGGMKVFVKEGQTVLIKPNMSFSSPPQKAATTNPILVKSIINSCFDAGAGQVYVIDHTLIYNCIDESGMRKAVNETKGKIIDADNVSSYKNISIPKAKILKSTMVHKLLESADVFINVPILKSHGGAKMTCALKNLMGVVWDRHYYHREGLNQCIADFPLYRKPDLNIVDAYYVMLNGGPRGNRMSKVINPKMQFISRDIVAADSISLKQARAWGMVKGEVPYVKMAFEHGLGKIDIASMNIQKIIV